MRQIHIISQLFLENGILKSKVGRATRKVHYRQGDLDGACGAYSIAMALNAVGAFDANYLNKEKKNVDFRTADGKLHKAIHDWGLFPDGLESKDCCEILNSLKKKARYEYINSKNVDKETLQNLLDEDIPLMLNIMYPQGGHWIVVIGYEKEDEEVTKLYTLDPGGDLPKSAYWNGMIDMTKKSRKLYCYNYYATTWSSEVKIQDAIAIWRK